MGTAALHHIDGQTVASADGRESASRSPSDKRELGSYSDGGLAEAEQAVAAARRAFETAEWAHHPRKRAAVLLAMADAVEAQSEPLARTLAQEVGIPISDAGHEVRAAHGELRYYAGMARTIFGRIQEIEAGLYSAATREPYGVAGIIVPWNAPLTLLVRSLAPALAAGNSVAVKVPGSAALVVSTMVGLLAGVDGLPPGIVNAFVESGSDGARVLVASPDVDIVSYTGGTAVGKEIMRAAAETVKPLSLELGGSAPVLVFADADVAAMAKVIARNGTVRAGQHCTAANRVIAHESIANAVAEALIAELRAIPLGDPLDPAITMGPMIDDRSRERVEALLEDAGSSDEMLLKGERPRGDLEAGTYLTPSLVSVRSADSPMLRDEVFGPALSIDRFSEEDEAVGKANASVYGLSASVWSSDLSRSLRVARGIKAGTVWINGHNRLMAEAETGGYRQSGIGRLHGIEGLETFLQTKTISYHLEDD